MCKSALKVIYFVYCIFQMYIFLYYTVGILWTAKEEFHCTIENMFLYCAYDNKHFESWILNKCSGIPSALTITNMLCFYSKKIGPHQFLSLTVVCLTPLFGCKQADHDSM